MQRLHRFFSCNVIVAACMALSAAVGPSPAQSQTAASPGAAAKLDYLSLIHISEPTRPY